MAGRPPEGEPRIRKEHAAVRRVRLDPASLIRKDNLAAQIIDTGHASKFKGTNFNPDRYVESETVRVSDDPYATEGFDYRLIDGHHRTQGADEYVRTVDPYYEYWSNDVTDDIIAKNPRYAGQTHLTYAQYLSEVIFFTKAHREIASARMAGHFMSEWRNMVGDEVAEEYSALAAVSFLSGIETKNQPDDRIARYFNRLRTEGRPLMAHETPAKRDALEEGLRDMAGVIRDTKLGHEEIQLAAFRLLATEDERIGGSELAVKEITGLVHHPRVDAILRARFDGSMLEQQRSRLLELIIDAFGRVRDPEDIRSLSDLVGDEHINHENMVAILAAPKATDKEQTLTQRYDGVKHRINVSRLTAAVERIKEDGTSDVEDQLIEHLAGTKIFSSHDIKGASAAVVQARMHVTDANKLILLIGDNEQLRNQILSLRDAVLEAGSTHQLRRTTNALQRAVAENRSAYVDATVRELVDTKVIEVFSTRHLAGPAGAMVKDQVMDLVLQHVDTSRPENIERMVTDIWNLGEELFMQVVRGELSLPQALRQRRMGPADISWIVRDSGNADDAEVAATSGALVNLVDLQQITDQYLLEKVAKGEMTVATALGEQEWRAAARRRPKDSGTGSSGSTRTGSPAGVRPAADTEDTGEDPAMLRDRITYLEGQVEKLQEHNTHLTEANVRLTEMNAQLQQELDEARGGPSEQVTTDTPPSQ